MPTIRFDKLIDHYLPTYAPDSPHFHPENVQELSSELGDDGLLHIDEQVTLEDYGVPYKQLAFISQSDDGTSNQKVYYLNLVGEEDNVADLEIVTDMAASNARALHVSAGHVLVFKTSYPYNPQTLKKMSVRLRAITPGDIRIGLVGISDKAYVKPDETSGFPTVAGTDDMYEIVVGADNVGDITSTYSVFTGYFKGLSATPLTQSFPSPDPNTPYALLDDTSHEKTTTDVAMAIKCISGDYYIDSLELFDVENAIIDIPGGQAVEDAIDDLEIGIVTSQKASITLNQSAFPFDDPAVDLKYAYIGGYGVTGAVVDENGYIYAAETGVLITLVPGVVDCTGFVVTGPKRLVVIYDTSLQTYIAGVYSANDSAYVDSTATVISGAGYQVIGHVVVDVDALIDGEVWIRTKSLNQAAGEEKLAIMSYLNVEDPVEFKARAEEMGFENVFSTLAVYDAFVQNMYAQVITMGETGEIKSSHYEEVAGVPTIGYKLISETGEIKAVSAKLYDAYIEGNIYSGGEYTGSIKNGQIESVDGTGDAWVFSDTDAGDDVVDVESGQTRYERMLPATTGEPDGTATITGKFVYPKTNYTLSSPQSNTMYHGGMFDGANYIFVGGYLHYQGYPGYYTERSILAYGASISSLNYSSDTNSSTGGLYDIAYGNNTFITVGGGRVGIEEDSKVVIRRSTSLTSIGSWTTILYDVNGRTLFSVAFGDNKFVAVGYGGQIKYSNSDGTTWTNATSGTTSIVRRVRYLNGYFYAVGDMGILRSSDGITWTSVYSSYQIHDIAYDGTTFTAVGKTIATSLDGETWTDAGYSLSTIESITYNGGYEFMGFNAGRGGGRLLIGGYGIVLPPTYEAAPNTIYIPTFLFNVSTTSVVVIYDDPDLPSARYVQEFPIATNTHDIYAIAKSTGTDSTGDYIDIILTYVTGGTLPLSDKLRVRETSDDFLVSMSVPFEDRLKLKKTMIPESSITQIGDSSNLFPKIYTEDLRLAVYTDGSQVDVMSAYGCRAWVNFNGRDTVSIRASENVSSITDVATGRWRINFTNAMPDVNYSMVSGIRWLADGAGYLMGLEISRATAPTTSWIEVEGHYAESGNLYDCEIVNVAVFR